MELHQEINKDVREMTCETRTYDAANFHRFFNFLDALECRSLRNSSFKRIVTKEGIVWDDNVRNGGIKMITEFHPTLNHNSCGKLMVQGTSSQLDEFELQLKQYIPLN